MIDNLEVDDLGPDEDDIVVSEPATPITRDTATVLGATLQTMGDAYRENPVRAVRGQHFIRPLHTFIGDQLESRLTRFARRRGIIVVSEAKILGSTKPKDVDISVVDPQNGPLVLVGIRSQMSSVGKNVLNYYEGIVGECISLQQRFPMSTHAYVYLHPLRSIKADREDEAIDHARYARMYSAVTGRSGPDYKSQRGIFDEFAYMIVDFESPNTPLRDDLVQMAVPNLDMSIGTLVDRIVNTFNDRLLFWDVLK